MKEVKNILDDIKKYATVINRKVIKEGYEIPNKTSMMNNNETDYNDDDEYDNYNEDMSINDDEYEDDDEKSSINLDDNQVVNKLRKLALKGIQKYSEEVSNPLYEFYKKIWAECDKLITDMAKKQEIGGKKR